LSFILRYYKFRIKKIRIMDMKIFSVIGYTQSGKTTTIENIIKELKKRNYKVGTIKDIHFEKFKIDKEGTNTYRHSQAGSELVTARGYNETDILFPRKLSLDEILDFYTQDFVIAEGAVDNNLPIILCAIGEEDAAEKYNDNVFAISGKISNSINEFKGIPVINAINDIVRFTDLIEEKVFERMPDYPADCCNKCGFDCRTLGVRILKGQSKREDCVIVEKNITLKIGSKEIEMVPFVQGIFFDVIESLVKNLKGYKKGKSIEIKIGW
jgi:molybdopterin-guanine dinucleotide biosynthesis adapter protein